MRVLSDTSPLNYLIQVDAVHCLEQLYGNILIPTAVVAELVDTRSPSAVRGFATTLPNWVEVVEVRGPIKYPRLQLGEREVLALAEQTSADLLLLDDLEARTTALSAGFKITGTLGVLVAAIQENILDRSTINRLRQTKFRIAPKVLAQIERELGS
jgi:predicted nucleic acid-binding protein